MIRLALDSDQPEHIPATVDFVLTYSDLVLNAHAFEQARPGQQVAFIDRGQGDPGDKATIIDVETGAYTPAHLPKWYDLKAKNGHRYLTYYCNRSTFPVANKALGGRQMFRWIATLDGTAHIDGFDPLGGPDLVQILGADSVGVHADMSLVLNPLWRPSPVPQMLKSALSDVNKAQHDVTALHAALNPLRALIHAL